MNMYAVILFFCALIMGCMGMARRRAGQKRRALLDFFMAASMTIFGMGLLGR
jgi:hypothetical protein